MNPANNRPLSLTSYIYIMKVFERVIKMGKTSPGGHKNGRQF